MIREVHRGIRAQRVRDGDRDEKSFACDLLTGAADEGRLGSIIVEGQRDLRRTGAIGTAARNECGLALETLRDMQARFARRNTGGEGLMVAHVEATTACRSTSIYCTIKHSLQFSIVHP